MSPHNLERGSQLTCEPSPQKAPSTLGACHVPHLSMLGRTLVMSLELEKRWVPWEPIPEPTPEDPNHVVKRPYFFVDNSRSYTGWEKAEHHRTRLEVTGVAGEGYAGVVRPNAKDPRSWIDFDRVLKDGQLLPEVGRLLEVFGGVRVTRSYSERGVHVVGFSKLPPMELSFKGEKPSVKKLGRFLALMPERVHREGDTDVDITGLIGALHALYGKAQVIPERESALQSLTAVLVCRYPETSRHDFALKLAGTLRRCGLTLEEAEALYGYVMRFASDEEPGDRLAALRGTYQLEDDKGIMHLGMSTELDEHRNLAMTLATILGVEGAFGPLTRDDFRAYMPQHAYIFEPTGELWPAASVASRLGKLTPGWLDRHRAVEQMTWVPGFQHIIEGQLVREGGWIAREGVNCYNLYLPPTLESGNASEAQRYVDLVHRLYPDEAEHILDYFAHRCQHPEEKVNHALFLGGAPGIGKDTIVEPLKYAVGPWNFKEVKPSMVMDTFNPWMKCVVLRVSEAHDLGDVSRYSFYEHMKTYIASPPDVLTCNDKNIRQHPVFNRMAVIFTSNYKTGGIYLPRDDRRHFVAWSNEVKENFTEEFWNSLYTWYEAEGYRHVAALLRTRDISRFNAKAPPKLTPAFFEIADSNATPEEAELADALDVLGNPDAVSSVCLSGTSSVELLEWFNDRKNARHIASRFEKVGYVRVRNPDEERGLWPITVGKGPSATKRRVSVFARKELSLQQQLVAARKLAGGPIQGPEF